MSTAKAIANTIVENSRAQRTIFRALMSVLIVLSAIYVYLIGAITFNVLARKSLDATVHTLGSQVSGLELTYLNETNGIDQNYAHSLGFVEVENNIFATREIPRVAMR
jgi:hypothetical protein